MTAKEIAQMALRLDPAERAAYLQQVCAGHTAVFIEALAFLKAEEEVRDDTLTLISETTRSVALGSIGPYRLVKKIGEGGMGVVYHALQQEPIRREVALKVIKPGMDSAQVILRFESERQSLAQMDHPNIARIFDAGTTASGGPYFVMELVDGVPITEYCREKGMDIRQRIELFIPVCEAIQHAHQKGIIHRDVKPSNVLVKQQESHAIPKVIDFGLAKALSSSVSDATMATQFGSIVGTLDYMSPEQAGLGRQDVDTRSDIYSLGALLYELLTGVAPLEYDRASRPSYMELLGWIREKPVVPPNARLQKFGKKMKTLDQDLDWIAMKTLEKDRTQRYETANALIKDLQRYLNGEPVEAGPPSKAYRLGKFARRYRWWLATAATFVLVLASGVGVSTWMAVRASRAELRALRIADEAEAVRRFLEFDLLKQAEAGSQSSPSIKPDPELKVRTALDRAAQRISGRFDKQPLVEASLRLTIGSAYRALGLYALAEPQLKDALNLRLRVLGPDHQDTLSSMEQTGMLKYDQGRYDEAENIARHLAEVQGRLLGREHPITLRLNGRVSMLLMEAGKFTQGEPLLIQTVEAMRRSLGEEDPQFLMAEHNLGIGYLRQKKLTQAEDIFARVVKTRQRKFGAEHPDTLQSIEALAVCYFLQKKYSLAVPLQFETFRSRLRVLGETHPDTLYSMYNLACSYRDEGKYAQAEPLFVRTIELRRRVLGAEHTRTIMSIKALVGLYEQWGRPKEAAEWRSRLDAGKASQPRLQ